MKSECQAPVTAFTSLLSVGNSSRHLKGYFCIYCDFLVIMSQCFSVVLVAIRVQVYLLQDMSINTFPRGCPCYVFFFLMCRIDNAQLCYFLFTL